MHGGSNWVGFYILLRKIEMIMLRSLSVVGCKERSIYCELFGVSFINCLNE